MYLFLFILIATLFFLTNSLTMSPSSVVISGASKGIGLEFCRQILARSQNTHVFALMRDISCKSAIEMKAVYQNRYVPLHVDLTKQDTIDKVSEDVRNSLMGELDLVINVAGLLGSGTNGEKGPERSISHIDRDWLEMTMQTNLIGYDVISY
jgi:NAD(P)-dependent dehydrogenase (short-subunit alcohol dehydrogenase family)